MGRDDPEFCDRYVDEVPLFEKKDSYVEGMREFGIGIGTGGASEGGLRLFINHYVILYICAGCESATPHAESCTPNPAARCWR
jgi:hypothetical protein